MIFTVQVKKDDAGSPIVEILLDREGLEDLKKQTSFLKKVGDHSDFFTADWGGLPLTKVLLEADAKLANMLRVRVVEGDDQQLIQRSEK